MVLLFHPTKGQGCCPRVEIIDNDNDAHHSLHVRPAQIHRVFAYVIVAFCLTGSLSCSHNMWHNQAAHQRAFHKVFTHSMSSSMSICVLVPWLPMLYIKH